MNRIALLALGGLLAAGVAWADPPQPAAVCVLKSPDGTLSKGEVWFRDTDEGLAIGASLSGLKPGKTYRLFLHVQGDLGLEGSAGFGKLFERRGVPHAGEMGRMLAETDGRAWGLRVVHGMQLTDVLGRGITLRDPDRKLVGLGVPGRATDPTPPTLKLKKPPEVQGKKATLTLDANDNRALVALRADGGGEAKRLILRDGPQFRVDVPSRSGENAVAVVATDGAGNTHRLIVDWEVDTTAPVIKVLAPRPGSQLNGNPVNVVCEVSDPNLKEVTIGPRPAKQDAKGRWRRAITARNGENHVKVRAKDRFGNSAEVDVSFLFDSTPPGVEAAVVIVVEGKVDDLSATLTINGQPVRYNPQTGAYSAKVKADPQDPSRVTIVATDQFGNRTTEVRKLR